MIDTGRSQDVIAALSLVDAEIALTVKEELPVEAFSGDYIILMSCVYGQIDAGHEVGVQAVLQQLEIQGHTIDVLAIASRASFIEDVNAHIDLLREGYLRNQHQSMLQQLTRSMDKELSVSCAELVDAFTERSYQLQAKRAGREHISSAELASIRNDMLEEKTEPGIYTGWQLFDEAVPSGFSPRDLSVIASRTGVGKSSFRLSLTRRFCDRGKHVVLISTEMSKQAEFARLDAIMTGIPLDQIIRSWQWVPGDERMERIQKANEYIAEHWNYDMLFSRSIALADVRTFLQKVQRKKKVDIVFIDLFDRLTDVGVSENSPQTIATKIAEAAAIADAYATHVCLLAQINRQAARGGHRPHLHQLKGSGAYEEAARLVLLLYREAQVNPESISDNIEIIIEKQSQGQAPMTLVGRFDGPTTRIEL